MIVELSKTSTILKPKLRKSLNTKDAIVRNKESKFNSKYAPDDGKGRLESATDADIKFLKRLKHLSEKNLRFTEGKNKQEEVRLKLIHHVIEKNYDNKENNWFKSFIETKQTLEDIRVSTSTHMGDSNLWNESMVSFESLSFNARSRFDASSIKNYQTSSKSTSSNKTQMSLFSQILNSAREKASEKYTARDSVSAPSTIRPPKRYSINKFQDASCRLSADFYKNSNRKVKLNLDDQDDDLDDYYQETGENYRSMWLKSATSHHSDTSQKCTLFPCDLLKSYTSMLGPRKDRNQDQLESLCLRRMLNEKLLKIQYELGNKNNNSSRSLKKKSVEFLNVGESESLEELSGSNLNANKSIRRPLRRARSGREVLHKVSSLKNKADYCRRENEINFRMDDRNVRYGGEMPKKKISRQMKILSKFESILK
jgi:hypothetical protein